MVKSMEIVISEKPNCSSLQLFKFSPCHLSPDERELAFKPGLPDAELGETGCPHGIMPKLQSSEQKEKCYLKLLSFPVLHNASWDNQNIKIEEKFVIVKYKLIYLHV